MISPSRPPYEVLVPAPRPRAASGTGETGSQLCILGTGTRPRKAGALSGAEADQEYAPIPKPGNCAAAIFKLGLCLAAQTVDLLGDYLLRFSPWRPPSLGPEPPSPVILPPSSCLPPKYREPVDKGRTIGGNIGYPIAKYAQCWIDFYNECYGGDTEPWQQCCEESGGDPAECQDCCLEALKPGRPRRRSMLGWLRRL